MRKERKNQALPAFLATFLEVVFFLSTFFSVLRASFFLVFLIGASSPFSRALAAAFFFLRISAVVSSPSSTAVGAAFFLEEGLFAAAFSTNLPKSSSSPSCLLFLARRNCFAISADSS